jgi:hypothetical protein
MLWTLCLVLVVLLCAQPLYAQRQSYFIPPRDTDPQIDTDLQSHYAALNKSVPSKNQLFLFFPGTGGTPFFQQQLNNAAAELGFHVIGLNYPNDQAVNGDLCVGASADLDCYAKVRLEIKDGVDRTPLISITRANSIENRLIKLLVYLRAQFPDDGWGQYLTNEDTIKWSSIVVSGHSQGAGHAGIIGRYHFVARVVMFAGMDYSGREMKPANWIAVPASTPNATPEERFYGFSHQRDEAVNFVILSAQVWPAYGMNAFGPVVNVESAAPPYGNTHSLTSNLDTPTDNYHGSVAVDRNLALQADGIPVYKPVWEYLLSNTNQDDGPPAIASAQILKKGKPVDHLVAGTKAKKFQINLAGSGFAVGSQALIDGMEAETSLTSSTELTVKLPFKKLPGPGMLTVQVRNLDGQVSNTLNIDVRDE